MPRYWKSPIYQLKSVGGKNLLIDVTTSVSPGLAPHKVLEEVVIPYFKDKKVDRVLDFGAGALRHAFPLLDAGFQVCTVEFEEGFRRPASSQALAEAKKHANFSALVWPKDFIKDSRVFDAALLCFVLQVMPIHDERLAVLKYIYKKLGSPGYLLYMARFGQVTKEDSNYRVKDGYYKWPGREHHSFYTEFSTERTHRIMKDRKMRCVKPLSARGTEQVYIYGKGKATWP